MDNDLGPFGGENRKSNLLLGRQSLVTVDAFRRKNGSFFMRVQLRSDVKSNVISRYEVELDRYTDKRAFLRAVEIAGGALAEHQVETHKDRHDPGECAKVARELAESILNSGMPTAEAP